MRELFWNASEGRLRAGWRLLLAFFATGMAAWGVGTVLAAVAGGGLWVGVVAATIGITSGVWAASRGLDRRPLVDLGLRIDREWWADLAFGLALGVALAGVVFTMEIALGWVVVTGHTVDSSPDLGFVPMFLATTALFVAVAWYEELAFRGYLICNLAEGTRGLWGRRSAVAAGVVASAALFSAGHAANPNATVEGAVGILAAGLLIGFAYAWTGSLALPIGLHVTWNLAQGAIFGLPVSGVTTPARWIVVEERGPDLWTGGPFGPEAGLTGVAAMAIGAAAVFVWVRLRRGEVSLRLSIAEPPDR